MKGKPSKKMPMKKSAKKMGAKDMKGGGKLMKRLEGKEL